jgi:hypothetical protein
MIIHCCNCEACQRETGSAFALNVVVEADEVELLPGSQKRSGQSNTNDQSVVKPKLMLMPSESGQGQLVARCPICFVTVWSHYPGGGPWVSFIRGGTLDKTSVDGTSIKDLLEPDMYIYTKFKQPWVTYPKSAGETSKVVDEFYDPKDHWSDDAKQRFAATRERTTEWIERGRQWSELGDVVDLRCANVRGPSDDTQTVTRLIGSLEVS